jgi:hypothetical protein
MPLAASPLSEAIQDSQSLPENDGIVEENPHRARRRHSTLNLPAKAPNLGDSNIWT